MENSASVVNINSTREQPEQDQALDRCALRALGIPGEAITEYLESLGRDTAKNVEDAINNKDVATSRYHLLKKLLTNHHITVDVGKFNQLRTNLAQQDKDALMEFISTQDDVRTFCTLWNFLAQDPEIFQTIPTYLREAVKSFTDTNHSITPKIAQQVIDEQSRKNPNLTPPLPLLQNLFSETPPTTIKNSIDVTEPTNVIPFPENRSSFSEQGLPLPSPERRLEIQKDDWQNYTETFLKKLETKIPNIRKNIDPANIQSLACDINKILDKNAPTSILPHTAHEHFQQIIKRKLNLPLMEFVVAQQGWSADMIKVLKENLGLT